MADPDHEFEAIRRDPDPVRRGRRATELLGVYQQRSTELARLRRAAIEEARGRLGGSYTEVARAFGLSKGRITQIRTAAPPPERAFFGVGPVTVAIPGRWFPGRDELVIASEDDYTADIVLDELRRLAFVAERYRMDPDEQWAPAGDAVVICGPESAPVGAALLAEDPVLGFDQDDAGRWWLVEHRGGTRYGSPRDEDSARSADIAYLSHRQDGERVIVHLAGIHALGSIGAASYLTTALDELWAEGDTASFSMVVSASFTDQKPAGVEVLAGPLRWDQ